MNPLPALSINERMEGRLGKAFQHVDKLTN